MASVISWFRDDLRLDDNPALSAALSTGLPVVMLYVWQTNVPGERNMGGAARWWLYNALADLDQEVRRRGSEIVFIKGEDIHECLRKAARECCAEKIFCNRRYSASAIRQDTAIQKKLKTEKIEMILSNATLLREPEEVKRGKSPYRVFTAYYKLAETMPFRIAKEKAPENFDIPRRWPAGCTLDGLELLQRFSWTEGLEKSWVPTFAGLETLLKNLSRIVPVYDKTRDFPNRDGTSRLSPYLRFGQVSPSQIVDRLHDIPDSQGKNCFVRELHWREFAHNLFYHFPHLPEFPLNTKFINMPWREDCAALAEWQRGMTGFPIVDAGMRQLWKTGWMHNRVRMIVGSFLVKDLLIDWRKGAEWFADTLVDADIANNSLGWQWIAGCGLDAAPFFRIFNPVSQSKKFDPDGYYIRRYVPELTYLSSEWIHCPWKAPQMVLDEAGVQLGRDYPLPIVNHETARKRALTVFHEIVGT